MSKVWDKIMLLSCLVILIGLAVYYGLNVRSVVAALKVSTSANGTAGKSPLPLEAAALQKEREEWLQPQPWEVAETDHQLFVGRRYLYFPSENVIKLYKDDLPIDGIPLGWLDKYKLPISDVLIGHRDTDGDGFTNIAEYKTDTNPLDAKSHPPYTLIMRMKGFAAKRYRVKFQNKTEMDGQDVYQLATIDSPKRSRIVKKEEVFDGFKVIDYQQKSKPAEPPDYVSDISELTILNTKTGETIVLVFNRERDVPEVTASFVYLIPGLIDQPVSCKVGDEFTLTVTLPDQSAVINKYKLLKAAADSAVVHDKVSNSDATIPAFDEKVDLDLVPQ